MAINYKILGQSAPAANTSTDLYTVPSAKEVVCSSLVICNRGSGTTFRVSIRPDGATLANSHYLVYETPINQFDTVTLTLGITANAADVVTVYAGSDGLSFNLFGSEIT